MGSEVKHFYGKNKDVIDTINKFVSLYDFVSVNYDYQGKLLGEYDKLDYYYNYILKNRDNMDKIFKLLDSLKKLGLKSVDLNENYDFTKDRYQFTNESYMVGNRVRYYNYLNYLENMEVMPNCFENSIYYYTKGSNYRILIHNFDEDNDYNDIMVNNLVFDVGKLPKNLSKEETLDKVIRLHQQNKEENKIVRNYVELSVTIDNLEKQYEETSKVIDKLDKVSNKDEFMKVLVEIKQSINKLKELELIYNNNIVNDNEKILERDLKEEKSRFLCKRLCRLID